MLAHIRRLLPLLITAALTLLITIAAVGVSAEPGPLPTPGAPDEAVLFAPDTPAPDGAAMLTAIGGAYLSPISEAPRPFTHLLLRWDATLPLSATLQLEVRASLDGEAWTDWGAVPENHDLWMPEDGPERFWGQELYAGEGARFWQVRATLLPAPDGALPTLRQINVFTVDARFGPPEPTPDSFADGAAGLLARPPVVSRTAWGSPDGQGSRVPPAYRTVTHLVVHHTADSNSLAPGQRWSDRVRAIWSFHTNTRGWGDIGYNFLIDPDGVIYEGRAGGDDAVGFHDTANHGSMGVALIGTYSAGQPAAPAQDSLVTLLAWKAEQREIDPLGSSRYYGCAISNFCTSYTPSAIIANISGHRDVTPVRTTCPGDSLHALLPELRQRVRDRIGSAPPPDDPVRLELLGVAYDRTSVPAGELLKVTFTVRNSGSVAVEGQAPEAARDPGTGAYRLAESYVYDEGECFLGADAQAYPSFPKEPGRLRVTLGPTEPGRQPACTGSTSGYPWRWGINGRLEPGEVREVVGFVRIRNPGAVTLRAGAINEYVGYLADGVGTQTITVTPERRPPAPAAYDELLQPLAHVYRLGDSPDNLLARDADGTAAQRGALVGSFPWLGERRDWGEGGPLASAPDVTDSFVVEQTRVFEAPVAGSYEFRLFADDGGWLWVDGILVIGGPRTGADAPLSGTVELAAGRHVLAFRAYERAGESELGYVVRVPGAAEHTLLADGLGGADGAPAERFGAVFRRFTGMALAADDMGGSGVAAVRVSLNGGEWVETAGAIARLGPLADGSYRVRYVAVDREGNLGEERELAFRVDSSAAVWRTYLPLAMR